MIDIRIDVYHHFELPGEPGEVLSLLRDMKSLQEKLTMTQAELAAQLTAAKEEVIKVQGETRKLIDLNKTLLDAIANGPAVSPEVKQAADELSAQVKVADDLIPDVPAPPPVVPPA